MSPGMRGSVRRIAIIAQSGASLLRFRGALMRAVAERRHRVLAIAPELDEAQRATIAALGVESASFPAAAAGASPLAKRRSVKALEAVLSEFRPHVALASGPRTASIGALMARAAGAERVLLMVNGLRALELGPAQPAGFFAQRAVARRDAKALAAADLVVFHNAGDRAAVLETGLLPATAATLVVPGSGVDLARFAQADLPSPANGLVFLMPARLEKATGVETFAEAAQLVKAKSPSAHFVLCGPPGKGADAVAAAQVARWKGTVEYVGAVADIRPLLAAAHVIVYPATGEGCPGAILEALSIGRPVVTSTEPGCAQTVDERANGVLVPPHAAQDLAEAMQFFLRRPDLLPAMARASRLKAERSFAEGPVVAALLQACGID